MPSKSISEGEIDECISEKVDEGVPQEQAVTICLSEAEEGNATPEDVNGINYLKYLTGKSRDQVIKAVEDVDTVPTNEMANIASQVLEKIDDTELDNDQCGTRTGLERANQLENQEELSADTIGRMVSFFARHDGNQEVETENKWEDCGFVAWQLWGGDPGRDWAERKQEQIEEEMEEESAEKQADFEFEVGDWVNWEFAEGTSQGQITERENEPGESLSAQGNEREATETEPVYKMEEWDEEEQELTNNVVKSESELSEIDKPENASKNYTMDSKTIQEQKNRLNQNQEEMKTIDFQIKGKDVELVKQEENSDGDVAINVPIQAVSEDRDGDIITDQGQDDIIRQLRSGTVPLMLNHGVGSNPAMYDVRDIVGQFVDGEKEGGTTMGVARMRKKPESDELTSDAKEIVDLLKQDMPIGFSVGFIPKDVDEKENGGTEIKSLDLMEVSAVGIPSNPDAVPQAMGTAVQMAKSAGLSKQKIAETVQKAFEDTMSEKQEQDGTDSNQEDSKSEEQDLKQITQEDMDAVLGAVGGALDAHMDAAMQDIEEELESMIMEEDEMDEDEEDEDKVTDEDEDDDEEEMSQDDASDHTEDDKSSESADEKSDKDEDVPNTAEGNQEDGEKTINETDNSEQEEKSDTDEISQIAAEKGEMW